MSDLGAVWLDESRCRFRVWAPLSGEVQLHILSPQEYLLPMQQKPNGYHQVTVEKLPRGARYKYRLATGKELPDPVRSLPKAHSRLPFATLMIWSISE